MEVVDTERGSLSQDLELYDSELDISSVQAQLLELNEQVAIMLTRRKVCCSVGLNKDKQNGEPDRSYVRTYVCTRTIC